MTLTPDFYVLLALLVAVAIFAVVLLQRVDALTRQLQESAKRQDEAEAALREHVKASASNLDQRLARSMEADAKAQTTLDALVRAQHAAIEANTRATAELAGAIADLRLALLESTKL